MTGHTFRITTHDHLEGVRLSCDGGWGGVPFRDEAAARAAIEVSARGDPHVVKVQHVRWGRQLRDTSSDWLAAS